VSGNRGHRASNDGGRVSNVGECRGLEGMLLLKCLGVTVRHLAEGLSIVKAHFSDSSTDIIDPQLSNSPQ